MRDEAEAGEEERQKYHEANKQDIKVIRREEKFKKRRLNIEIASEIIDLIIDVADEAFGYQEEHKMEDDEESRKLHKEIWRDWMGIFASGKKVSEANIVIQQDEAVEKHDDQSPLGKLLGLGHELMTSSKLIDRVKHEQIYTDLLQYIAIAGQVNMKIFAPDKWENMINVALSDPSFRDRK